MPPLVQRTLSVLLASVAVGTLALGSIAFAATPSSRTAPAAPAARSEGSPIGPATEDDAFVPVRPTGCAFEPIAPDYANVRGLNYVPHWAGSSVGTWRDYDSAQVERDLGYLRGIGCNTVRVWLSEAVYRVEGPLFLAKLDDFLSRCESHCIGAILVLWDDVGLEPSAVPYDDLTAWVKNPGTASALDPRWWEELGDPYVAAVASIAAAHPALLLWDVMNEPGPLPFLEHYAELVDALAPADAITIGWAAAHSNAATAAWPEVDVLSYHPYGSFRQNVELWTARAREISADNGGKPILATEIGSPGIVQRYEDALDHITCQGVGFLLFQAMIGPAPHFNWWQDGFFYEDGEVRDLEGVLAFRAVSAAQGFPGPLPRPVEKPSTDPLFLPMHPVPLGFGAPELVAALGTWLARPPLEPDEVPTLQTISTWASISIAWLGLLQPVELAAIQYVSDRFDEAVEAGDYGAAEYWLDAWGLLNGWYVATYGLGG